MNRLHRFLSAACIPMICSSMPAQEMAAYTDSLARHEANFSQYDGKRASYCSLRYGSPQWRAEHGKMLDKLRGSRIRFGKDSWAQLELNTAATLGGKSLEAGAYCLALDLSKDGEWSLVLLDAAEMRQRSLHGFATARIQGIGELYPLEMSRQEKTAQDFRVSFQADEQDPAKAELRIRFGPIQLSAEIRIDLDQAPTISFPKTSKN